MVRTCFDSQLIKRSNIYGRDLENIITTEIIDASNSGNINLSELVENVSGDSPIEAYTPSLNIEAPEATGVNDEKDEDEQVALLWETLCRENWPKPNRKCDICQYTAPSGLKLLKHRYRHTSDALFTCIICSKTFDKKHKLNTHVRYYKHSNRNCDICQKRFKSEVYYEAHLRVHAGNSPFECSVCHEQFAVNSMLKDHLSKHSDKLSFQCKTCQTYFPNISALRAHKRTHIVDGSLDCDVCHKRFSSKNFLKRHRLQHDAPVTEECNVCHKRFAVLEKHMRLHTGDRRYTCTLCYGQFVHKDSLTIHKCKLIRLVDKNFSFECNICHKHFKLSSKLQSHRRVHNGRNKCDVCLESFPSKAILMDHKATRTNKALHDCHVCRKRFHTLVELRCHRLVHSVDLCYCLVCYSQFSTAIELNTHLRTHVADIDFECDVCHKRMSTMRSLKIHKTKHAEVKRYKCDECPKTFHLHHALKQHKYAHRDLRTFECDICHKFFSNSTNLKGHKRTHTNEKPFPCGFCDKSFSMLGNCKRHERSHTGEKPFECAICQKRTSTKQRLREHVEMVHINKKWYKCELCSEEFPMHCKSRIRIHKRLHAGKKPYGCLNCDKGFDSRGAAFIHMRDDCE